MTQFYMTYDVRKDLYSFIRIVKAKRTTTNEGKTYRQILKYFLFSPLKKMFPNSCSKWRAKKTLLNSSKYLDFKLSLEKEMGHLPDVGWDLRSQPVTISEMRQSGVVRAARRLECRD